MFVGSRINGREVAHDIRRPLRWGCLWPDAAVLGSLWPEGWPHVGEGGGSGG